MKNPITLYVVRHGQSWANKEDIIGADFDLSPEGIKQAEKIGERLRNICFELIVSSDLLRAKRTAKIIAKKRRLPLLTSPMLRERHYGIAEGKKFTDLSARLQEALYRFQTLTSKKRHALRGWDGMETDEELISRVLAYIRKLAATHGGKSILMASHGDVMAGLLVHLKYADRYEMGWGCIDNTGYFVVKTDGIEFELITTFGIRKLTPHTSAEMVAFAKQLLLLKDQKPKKPDARPAYMYETKHG